MTTINVPLQPAPTTPLNLRLGVAYAPRVPAPPFVGFTCVEVVADGVSAYEVWAYRADGTAAITYQGGIVEAFHMLAAHLRLDVPPLPGLPPTASAEFASDSA